MRCHVMLLTWDPVGQRFHHWCSPSLLQRWCSGLPCHLYIYIYIYARRLDVWWEMLLHDGKEGLIKHTTPRFIRMFLTLVACIKAPWQIYRRSNQELSWFSVVCICIYVLCLSDKCISGRYIVDAKNIALNKKCVHATSSERTPCTS